MPELPEVETVCQGLASLLQGRTLKNVKINRPNLRYSFPPLFVEYLTKRTVKTLWRRAKYIIVEFFDTSFYLIIHLGMSGHFWVSPKADLKEQAHDHVVLTLDNDQKIIYRDPRRFGFMDLILKNELPTHRYLQHLGLEPFDENLTAANFHQLLKRKNQPIKQTLLDQTAVVGVGNIYASESLWESRLHPFKLSKTLGEEESNELLINLRLVLNRAIDLGGSTLRDHHSLEGTRGRFQNCFKAYNRRDLPCLRPKCSGHIQKQAQAGRASYFCGVCQVLA